MNDDDNDDDYPKTHRDQALYCTSSMNSLLMAGISTYNIYLNMIIKLDLSLHAALTSDDSINLLLMYIEYP
jgi:hypothetical protein